MASRPDVDLRPVVSADREFLFRVYASTRAEEMALVEWSDDEKHRFLDMQFNAQDTDYRRRFPDADYSVVIVDGLDAGRIWVHRAPDEVLLLDIALLPKHRNRGVGTSLLVDLQSEARRSGVPMRDSVLVANEGARRLYARLGFEVVDEVGPYLGLQWRSSDR